MPEPAAERTALVTGASRGIGAAIARALGRTTAGPSVSTTAPIATGADAVVAAIEGDGGAPSRSAPTSTDRRRAEQLFAALESQLRAPGAGARQQRRDHGR